MIGVRVAVIFLIFSLCGCGTLNAYTGAGINLAESDYVGAKQNLQAVDDAKLIAWIDASCAINVGALRRNPSGNPQAIRAVLLACPIPNIAVIGTDGTSVSIMTMPAVTAPSPTPGIVGKQHLIGSP